MNTGTPGRERMVPNSRDLDPATFRRLVGYRFRKRVKSDEPPVTDENRRRALEREISSLEKIDQSADFLPVSYLADGVLRAKAVCRIASPTGLGTGFLVAPGVIMTNNHVLENRAQAESAVAEFNFESGLPPTVVQLQPDRLFLTDLDLDFTIVGCDSAPIADIVPITLLRDPAMITRGELAAIIQHPAGRQKEIALHNNEVTRVQDKVVHYRTDTEPGSSGSPVFNNQWQIVALHHAGWFDPDGRATNEGVLIGGIVAKLEQMGYDGIADHERFETLLNSIRGTSPFLGFFDRAGLSGGPQEVVVPDYIGSNEFADIGFWNIEHFNSGISDQRVQRVADVFQNLQMDAMGLTEVERPALERLVDELGERGLSYKFRVSDGPGSQDVAILYDDVTTEVRLRKDLIERHATRLSAKTATGKTAFPRLPLIAECTVVEDVGSQPLRFLMMVVHLKAFGDALSRARRALASSILSEIISDLRETEGMPVILGGDFNDLITSDSLSALRDAPDLFSMTLDDATGDDASAITYVGSSHRSLIDHIVVSGDVVPGPIMGDDAAIVRLDRSVSDFSQQVSDHIPIVFRMVYRSQEIEVRAKVRNEVLIGAMNGDTTGKAVSTATRGTALGSVPVTAIQDRRSKRMRQYQSTGN